MREHLSHSSIPPPVVLVSRVARTARRGMETHARHARLGWLHGDDRHAQPPALVGEGDHVGGTERDAVGGEDDQGVVAAVAQVGQGVGERGPVEILADLLLIVEADVLQGVADGVAQLARLRPAGVRLLLHRAVDHVVQRVGVAVDERTAAGEGEGCLRVRMGREAHGGAGARLVHVSASFLHRSAALTGRVVPAARSLHWRDGIRYYPFRVAASLARAAASALRNSSTSVTSPIACAVPRSAILVTTAGLMSTATQRTAAGSRLPVAMAWSMEAAITATATPRTAWRMRPCACTLSVMTPGMGPSSRMEPASTSST